MQVPGDDGNSPLQRFQASCHARRRVPVSQGAALIDAFLGNAGIEQGITLQVEELTAVRLRDPRTANQLGVCISIQNRRRSSRKVAQKDATGCLAGIGGFLDTAGRNQKTPRFLESRKSRRTPGRHYAKRRKAASLSLNNVGPSHPIWPHSHAMAAATGLDLGRRRRRVCKDFTAPWRAVS